MSTNDEKWTQGRLHAHYQRHQQGYVQLDTELLVQLREASWAKLRILIGKEVAALMPTVLTPPSGQREQDHEAGTVLDNNRTVRWRQMSHCHEPLTKVEGLVPNSES